MQRNQTTPVKIVSRSRFRSTTDDEPSEELTPPPNRSDKPPPLPLWSSTSSTISRLVMMRTTEIPITTADSRPSGCFLCYALSGTHGQSPVPADPDELTGIEAGRADQSAIDGWLRHDRSDVVGLNRPAIQDTHIEGHIVPVNRGNPLPDRLAHLLGVLRAAHLPRADPPYRPLSPRPA